MNNSPQSIRTARDWPPAIPAALSALLALALYAVTLGGTYIYDDAQIIGLDPRVKNPRLWWQFWTRDYFNGGLDNLYRPLVSQSYGLQWWLHGDRPWAFHLVNLFLHATAAALVAELARRLVNWRVGLIAGLLFAALPVHAEAVAGVVGRAELACAVGIVGAMVLFLKRPLTVPRVMAIYALSVLALLSKEQGMLLPMLLGGLLPVRQSLPNKQPLTSPPPSERQSLMLLFALILWTVGGVIFLREEILGLRFEWDRVFLDPAMQPMVKSAGLDRWLVPVALLGRYFQLLVAPIRLSIDYGLDVLGPTVRLADPYLWLGFAVLSAAFAGAIIALLRRRWVVLFCLFALALTYSMASNIVIIGAIFGERLLYIPSVFFLILLAIALARLPSRIGIPLLTFILILACLRTFTYVRRWNDRDAFYDYSLHQQPRSLRINLLVAFVDYEKGRLDDARRVMARAEMMDPTYWRLWEMSAMIEEKAENWGEAVKFWKRAFAAAPSEGLEAHIERARQMHDRQYPPPAPSTRQ